MEERDKRHQSVSVSPALYLHLLKPKLYPMERTYGIWELMESWFISPSVYSVIPRVMPYLGLPLRLRWYRIYLQYGRRRFNPWVGKIPWRRNGNQIQYSCLENSRDRRAWWATVHGIEKSRTWLSEKTFWFVGGGGPEICNNIWMARTWVLI